MKSARNRWKQANQCGSALGAFLRPPRQARWARAPPLGAPPSLKRRGRRRAGPESRRSDHRRALRLFQNAARPGSCRSFAGLIRPVLKHGPRSLTCERVSGWQTPTRRETEQVPEPYKTGARQAARCGSSPLPSKSSYAGTRKMVNYACAG